MNKIKNKLNKKEILSVAIIIIFSIFIALLKVFSIGQLPNILLNVSMFYKLIYVLCYLVVTFIVMLLLLLIIKLIKLNNYKYSKLIYGIIIFILGVLFIIKPTLLGL